MSASKFSKNIFLNTCKERGYERNRWANLAIPQFGRDRNSIALITSQTSIKLSYWCLFHRIRKREKPIHKITLRSQIGPQEAKITYSFQYNCDDQIVLFTTFLFVIHSTQDTGSDVSRGFTNVTQSCICISCCRPLRWLFVQVLFILISISFQQRRNYAERTLLAQSIERSTTPQSIAHSRVFPDQCSAALLRSKLKPVLVFQVRNFSGLFSQYFKVSLGLLYPRTEILVAQTVFTGASFARSFCDKMRSRFGERWIWTISRMFRELEPIF